MADTLTSSAPPGEYWGLEVIARRMGVSRVTILKWYERSAFFMLKRRRGPRDCWWTTEQLIQDWQIRLCVAYRKKWLEGRSARRS
jgi:hypothetical protein